ncbi:MAG: hypothetical protein OEV68_17600, partial [candidate division Zixibacteria bacterium]|nr:hypothetical protein [candidate division Zixibacteria bacterium]
MLTPETSLLRRSTLCAVIFVCFFCLGMAQASELPSSLLPAPLVISKSDIPLTPTVKRALIERDGDVVKVWVFFTDKSVFTEAEFASKASTLTIEPRALKRRAKVGRDQVVFVDLPVAQDYLNSVEQLGGTVRRVSRWLNAASYEIPADQLDAVALLPFVARIKPLATYKRTPLPTESGRLEDSPGQSLGFDAINYGISENQLIQINVPPVHEKGFSGSGVTLAIFDTGFRTSHEAFTAHYNAGHVLAEWDFIFNDSNVNNEAADWSSQWNNGT